MMSSKLKRMWVTSEKHKEEMKKKCRHFQIKGKKYIYNIGCFRSIEGLHMLVCWFWNEDDDLFISPIGDIGTQDEIKTTKDIKERIKPLNKFTPGYIIIYGFNHFGMIINKNGWLYKDDQEKSIKALKKYCLLVEDE